MNLSFVLQALHVSANLLWIGAIVGVAVILRAPTSVDAVARGKVAIVLYRRIANPAFIVSFVAGAALLVLLPSYYFVETHFMHAKLPLALGVIAIHHILGARARRMAAGEASPPSRAILIVLLVTALGAALLALLKPF